MNKTVKRTFTLQDHFSLERLEFRNDLASPSFRRKNVPVANALYEPFKIFGYRPPSIKDKRTVDNMGALFTRAFEQTLGVDNRLITSYFVFD